MHVWNGASDGGMDLSTFPSSPHRETLPIFGGYYLHNHQRKPTVVQPDTGQVDVAHKVGLALHEARAAVKPRQLEVKFSSGRGPGSMMAANL